MFKLLDTVVLRRDVTEAGLKRGDLVSVRSLHEVAG
jgi:hypothetical protein